MSQLRCQLHVDAPPGRIRRSEPITVGIPFPPGALEPDAAVLAFSEERPVPVQTRALDRWPDGSVRWLLVDVAPTTDIGASVLLLQVAEASQPTVPTGLIVSEERNRATVDTGAARFVLEPGEAVLTVETETGTPMDADSGSVRFQAANDDRQTASFDAVTIEERGPLRACIRLDGSLKWSSGACLDVTARVHFFLRSPVAKVVLTLRNPSAASHPGGYWELGQQGSAYLKDVSLVLRLADPGQPRDVRWSVEQGAPFVNAPLPAAIYQDSSGGDNWKSANHVNRAGVVTTSFRGYRWRAGDQAGTGQRANPIVDVRWGSHQVAVTVQHFWQNFPKSIRVDADEIRIGLWADEYSDVHEIQGGEQKTHTLFIAFGADRIASEPLEWCRTPVHVHASPEWFCSAGVVPFLVPASQDRHARYLNLISAALDGSGSFYAKREIIDEYGWRNFGDLYADHEAVRHTGGEPLVSHYNNQYDPIAAFAIHFMRTGDRRWKELCDDLAAHVADIDIYHTQQDRSAYNGGLFWHTAHYVAAGRSTHRGYPNAPGVWGGGPASEHDYSTGLMLQYFLTGDERYREAVLGLAQWVLDLDDGSKTPFKWLARGDTGWASMTAVPEYQGPGRGCAYSVQTMLNAFQLTAERRFLHKAEQLIARCIHPHDDIGARNLLDHERRWSYTVFLQALGRYLIGKAERGEIDRAYGYGFEAMLAYARWMLEHERPYLQSADRLEFANETWVAQDIRKSEVFQLAALCTEGDERTRFLEKAAFFFDYATKTLESFASRTLTRPLVLLLANGYAWAGVDPAAALPRSPETADFGAPRTFIPLKARALRRAKWLVMAGGGAAAAAAAYWLLF